MADLIERSEILRDLDTLWDYATVDGITASTVLKQFKTDVQNVPSVDAVPVVHGHWRIGDRTNVYGGREIICSQCGESFMVSPKTLEYLSDCERFCCRCGAKMDGKDEA